MSSGCPCRVRAICPSIAATAASSAFPFSFGVIRQVFKEPHHFESSVFGQTWLRRNSPKKFRPKKFWNSAPEFRKRIWVAREGTRLDPFVPQKTVRRMRRPLHPLVPIRERQSRGSSATTYWRCPCSP